MEVAKWVEIEEEMSNLMGWDQAIDEMVEIKREVAPKKPIYELSPREDKLLLFKLRQRYEGYREYKEKLELEKSSI
jgi:hypothetical protein|tara:strand:- start:243 stop:470 length:228 start_codon:yes stop_codon:yes gene_type:complete